MSELPDMEPNFVLTRISTSLNRKVVCADGSEDWRGDLLEWYRSIYWVWVNFFQEHKLTTRVLASHPKEIDRDFKVAVGDLTDEGIEMYIRGVEGKFYPALDRRDAAAQKAYIEQKNTSLLKKQLKAIRAADYPIPKRVIGRKGDNK